MCLLIKEGVRRERYQTEGETKREGGGGLPERVREKEKKEREREQYSKTLRICLGIRCYF